MPRTSASPAVQSVLKEKAAQRRHAGKSALDRGLEDTFPASDPVSATHTAVSAGRTDAVKTDRTTAGAGGETVRDEIRALRKEVSRLSEAVSNLASGNGRAARSEAASIFDGIDHQVREHPLASIGLVTAVAFLLGVTR